MGKYGIQSIGGSGGITWVGQPRNTNPPIVQQAPAPDFTDNTGGTPSGSQILADCTGGDTVSLAAIENNFATIAAEFASLIDKLQAAGLME